VSADGKADAVTLTMGTYLLGDAEEDGSLQELHLESAPSGGTLGTYDRTVQCFKHVKPCSPMVRDTGRIVLVRGATSGHLYIRLLDQDDNLVARYQYTTHPDSTHPNVTDSVEFRETSTGETTHTDLYDSDVLQIGTPCEGNLPGATRCAEGSS